MINRLSLKNFKCFENIDIEFSNLNVLAGVNSTGKSSIIQSMLLLRQTYDMDHISDGLHLNGDITNIGIGRDLLYSNSEKDEVNISLISNGQNCSWTYMYEQESDYLKKLSIGACEEKSVNSDLL